MRRAHLHILALTLASTFALAPAIAHAHPSWRDLGTFEREALKEANSGRALDFAPAPEGKTIAQVRIVNLNVFRRSSPLSFANFFHITSTEQSIRQELTFKRGDKFVWTNIKQTLRLLRVPFYTNVAVIVPLRSSQADHVDVLVVTRDRWSIRANTDELEFQNGTLIGLEMLPGDNNFLGRRKRLALELIADLGAYSAGSRYIDPNVLGKRYRLDTGAAMIFNRATGKVEGGKVDARFELPLWKFERRWGAHVAFDYQNSVFRQFQGTNLLIWEDDIPYEYRLRTSGVETQVVHQVGTAAKHRIAAGHRIRSVRPGVRDSFSGTADQRTRFEEEVLPRSERTSALFLRYESFRPTFVFYRNLDNYDLPEEQQTGPRATAEISQTLNLLGSEAEFLQFAATIGWWVDFKQEAYMNATAGFTARFQEGDLADNEINASIKLATGRFFGGRLRIVARGEITLRLNDLNNVLLVAGGATGLRGYENGAFTGSARAVGNVELRSRPYRVGFTSMGGLLFWDSGHAADSFSEIRLRNDVGFGLRMLIPQVSSVLYRFDLAFPLQHSDAGTWRFTAGFENTF